METAGLLLWVVLAWVVLNALIVVVWTGVGRFAKRANDPARRGLRAEALFTALGFLLVLGGGSLASPAVRDAVKEAVFSATGLGDSNGATHPMKQDVTSPPASQPRVPSDSDGSGGSQASPRPTSSASDSGALSVPTPSPSPTEEPSPSPTEEPSPSPTEEPSPSPTEEPSPTETPSSGPPA